MQMWLGIRRASTRAGNNIKTSCTAEQNDRVGYTSDNWKGTVKNIRKTCCALFSQSRESWYNLLIYTVTHDAVIYMMDGWQGAYFCGVGWRASQCRESQ